MRPTRKPARTAFFVLTVLAAVATGCGALPTAPGQGVALAPPSSRSAGLSTLPAEDPPSGGGVEPQPVADPLEVLRSAPGAGAMTVRERNVPNHGFASVKNGRWKIEVPIGAINGRAQVSVTVPGEASPACELGISPAEKNHFAVPVILVADCKDVPRERLATYVISWYDPATGTWVPVPGSSVDLKKRTVTAPLLHFSVYSVGPAGGKSGW
jgi:hypothetical protein